MKFVLHQSLNLFRKNSALFQVFFYPLHELSGWDSFVSQFPFLSKNTVSFFSRKLYINAPSSLCLSRPLPVITSTKFLSEVLGRFSQISIFARGSLIYTGGRQIQDESMSALSVTRSRQTFAMQSCSSSVITSQSLCVVQNSAFGSPTSGFQHGFKVPDVIDMFCSSPFKTLHCWHS